MAVNSAGPGSSKSESHPEFREKVQKMTTENGERKGLQQTLEERGFNATGMRRKCPPVCPSSWRE